MDKKTVKDYSKQIRSILRLAIPIIIGQLGAIITGLADTIMVGQHSTAELGAASFANNVINMFIILGTGFSFNLTPIIGENLAKNDQKKIGGWLKNSLISNLTTTLVITIGLVLVYFNIPRMGQPEQLLPLIKPYFLVSMVSIIFVMMANSFRQFEEGIMDASVSMWVLTIGNALNIFGNYLLIYGKGGFPEMGLLGAGISTLVSRIVILVMFITIFALRRSYHEFHTGFKQTGVHRKYWKRLNSIGWPIALQQGIEAATFSLTTIMVGWLGGLELAAHQIAISISTVSFTIYLGIGSATAIKTGIYKGSGNYQKVRHVTISGVLLAIMASIIMSTLLFFGTSTIVKFFSEDPAVLSIVVLLIPILILYQFGDSIQIVLANALRGISDVRSTMLIALVSYFLVALPAGYTIAFVLDYGIRGVWFSYPIGFTCGVLLLGLRAVKSMGGKKK